MRRRLSICLAVSLLCLATAAGAGARTEGRAGATQAKATPQHLLIYAQEYSLWPSRTRLKPGTVDVQLWNRGQDAHDVRIRRLNAQGMMVGAVLGGVSVTPAGAIHTGVWHLTAGRYEIYCSLPGHLAMGMHARLSVVS